MKSPFPPIREAGLLAGTASAGPVRPIPSAARAGGWEERPVVRLLLVEDSPGDALLVRESLRRDGDAEFSLVRAGRLDQALRVLEGQSFDAVLLDLGLPDGCGLETFDSVCDAARETPVIVLSGLKDEELAIRAVQHGAQDYLVKGQSDGSNLSRSIRYAIQRNQTQQQIQRLAFHDGLTDLPNRRVLQYALDRSVARARRTGESLALLFLDLDNLKTVNDTQGHKAGDELLKETARRLRLAIRESDTVARIGGDEFALVCPGISDARDAGALARKILEDLQAPFTVHGREVAATASIGIALYPGDGRRPGTLLRRADAAMYRAKQQGGNRSEVSSPGSPLAVPRRGGMGSALAGAIDRGEMTLRYQPQVELVSGRIVGMEALARWRHPRLGWVPPADFIAMAEKSGRIHAIGEWVLRTACRQGRAWRDAGILMPRLAVNLSVIQLRRRGLAETVRRILLESGLDAGSVELELTGGIPHDEREAAAALADLKDLGLRIALDDFGCGPSDLSSLKTCPLDTVKIDPLFVGGIGAGAKDESVLTAIIDVAHQLGMSVTAEGVETAEQADFLLGSGCDRAQGRHFSPPLMAEEAGLRLARRRPPAGGRGIVGKFSGARWRPESPARPSRRLPERRSDD